MLANAKATMDAAREKGVLICHCPITCEQQKQLKLLGSSNGSASSSKKGISSSKLS
jgi:hypothetical protein